MTKRILLVLFMIALIFITACSEDKVTPDERFDTYVKQWNEQDFEKMYEMLAAESKTTYETEQFVDRYNKVYEDISISDLKVSYKKLTDEQIEQAMQEGTATFPFTVEMESLAGPIVFDYKAKLIREGEEDKENWFISWDPGFIFPALKEGGEIVFETTTPDRGEILDRNEMPLAINDTVYEIGIVPDKLGENAENIKTEVGKLLNMSVEAIDTNLNAAWVKPDQFVPLKKISKEKEDVLDQLWNLDGILSREVTGRVYPSAEAAAHLVGYIGQITAEELDEKDPNIYSANDMIGKRGLEQLFEEQLKGEKGVKIAVSRENEEDVILAEIPVKDGKSISATIDVNIQDEIFDSFEGNTGTAAAIDPKSGETLALVSSPAFDPNELLYGISQNQWDSLQDDPKTPLLNRFSATYAPGSVIKPVTAAIGLQNGSIVPSEGLEINGLTWDNGEGWGEYQVRRVSESSKPVDLADALIRSDNIYFAMQAVKMGNKALVSGLEQFGFGEKIPFEYPLTSSTISSSGTLDGEVSLANTSYGQAEIELSILHLALTYTTFLNEGNMIKPTLLTSENTGQFWHEGLITKEQAELIQQILRDVVEKGTAKVAQSDELKISGKTGTAELKLSIDSKGHENGWFVGYPTDEQDILIAMMVEHSEDIGTSSYAAKKVADILLELK